MHHYNMYLQFSKTALLSEPESGKATEYSKCMLSLDVMHERAEIICFVRSFQEWSKR